MTRSRDAAHTQHLLAFMAMAHDRISKCSQLQERRLQLNTHQLGRPVNHLDVAIAVKHDKRQRSKVERTERFVEIHHGSGRMVVATGLGISVAALAGGELPPLPKGLVELLERWRR